MLTVKTVEGGVKLKLLRDILTGIDGETYDNIRFYMLLATFTYLGCTIWNLYKDKAFDPIAFGAGFAAISGGGAAGINLKMKTEPQKMEKGDGQC